MKETFRNIPRFPDYQISDRGNIRSLKFGKEKILKPSLSNEYYTVVLSHKGKSETKLVHQIVAMAFLDHVPCRHKIIVDHINGIKTDNRLINLQLATSRYNVSRQGGSSRFVGVSWDRKKWQVKISLNGKLKHLGLFDDEYLAAYAYRRALQNYLLRKKFKPDPVQLSLFEKS